MATTDRDYYELLGVPRDADETTIKKSFRRMARGCTSGGNSDARCTSAFNSCRPISNIGRVSRDTILSVQGALQATPEERTRC